MWDLRSASKGGQIINVHAFSGDAWKKPRWRLLKEDCERRCEKHVFALSDLGKGRKVGLGRYKGLSDAKKMWGLGIGDWDRLELLKSQSWVLAAIGAEAEETPWPRGLCCRR